MNEYRLATAGDAEKGGIGTMTDARWQASSKSCRRTASIRPISTGSGPTRSSSCPDAPERPAGAAMPDLRLSHLARSFAGGAAALADLSADIPAGPSFRCSVRRAAAEHRRSPHRRPRYAERRNHRMGRRTARDRFLVFQEPTLMAQLPAPPATWRRWNLADRAAARLAAPARRSPRSACGVRNAPPRQLSAA